MRRFAILIALCLFCVIVCFTVSFLSGASSITVTDKLGRTVTVNVPVRRAVVVITYELIPALGIWDQVAGVSRWAEEECDLYRTLVRTKPELKRPHVGVGTDVNIESVLALNPDLVITWAYNPKAIKFMEEKGLNVITIYPDSLPELYEVIRLHGKFFGKENRAEEVIGEMERIFDLVRRRVEKIPAEKRQRVIHLSGKPTTVSGAVGVTNDLITMIGGINLGQEIKDRYGDVSVERIVQWNPDVIFIWANAGYSPQWLIENSQWRHIKAIREGHVYKLPKWSTWSPRVAPVALWMAIKLYPQEFSDISFDQVADEFYRKVFGISFKDVQ